MTLGRLIHAAALAALTLAIAPGAAHAAVANPTLTSGRKRTAGFLGSFK